MNFSHKDERRQKWDEKLCRWYTRRITASVMNKCTSNASLRLVIWENLSPYLSGISWVDEGRWFRIIPIKLTKTERSPTDTQICRSIKALSVNSSGGVNKSQETETWQKKNRTPYSTSEVSVNAPCWRSPISFYTASTNTKMLQGTKTWTSKTDANTA